MSDRRELVFGVHAVAALFERDLAGVLELWVQRSRRDDTTLQLEARAHAAGIAVHRVPRDTLTKMAESTAHQGIVSRYRSTASVRHRPQGGPPGFDDLLDGLGADTFLLALDGVQDPHNLGACLRSANAAGVDAVLVPRHRSARLTPAARKVASGAAESTPLVTVTNLVRALRQLGDAGVRIVGAHPDAEAALHRSDLGGPIVLVLGGEGRGVRRLVREGCDLLVRIPMAGAVASLNASVATAICLFEVVRQRDCNRREPDLNSPAL